MDEPWNCSVSEVSQIPRTTLLYDPIYVTGQNREICRDKRLKAGEGDDRR